MQSQLEPAVDVDMSGSSGEATAPGNAPIANRQNGRSTLQANLNAAMLKRGYEYLYLIASDEVGLTKIGFSEDPIRRFSELQLVSAYQLRLHATFIVPKGCGPVFEDLLHRALAHCRTHGEWFKLSEDALAFFDEQHPFSIDLDKAVLEKPPK